MALCHFPTLSFFTPHKLHNPHFKFQTYHYPFHNNLIFTCSAEKLRKNGKSSKQSKSNEELCKEIKEFLVVMGMPEDYVPTMKELLENGRKDLANIVRRRGYKVITELLRNSLDSDCNAKKPSMIDQNINYACNDDVSDIGDNILVESSDSSIGNLYMVRPNGAIATDTSVKVCDSSKSSNLSLQGRAAKFVQTGKLDIFEDDNEVKNVKMPSEAENKFGNTMKDFTDDTEASLFAKKNNRDQDMSNQRLERDENDDDLTSGMAGENVNQAEIERLKAMLHQKEMELLELQQQIEKEKQSLCILQEKANNTEKSMELNAADESLFGLKEVEIEYWGNGENVEVAGSFNGWHNRMKMDSSPFSKHIEPPCSRSPKCWSTTLWLYPGIYEIKFIVDGNWRIDHNQEISTSCNITNNILRVDR